ncbi:sensor histidine kinase [Paenibacillus solisilvae]|uniref:Sensor histidine kinase n=1 Tax=Paenibacillus solisilvae TaxID=2486751 RepID=A0ABW0W324_9BACL
MVSYVLRLFAVRRSIQAKIFLSFIILTILTVSSVTWIWYSNTNDMLKANATNYVMDNIRDANHSLDLFMSDFVSLTTLIAMNQENIVKTTRPRFNLSPYDQLLNRQKAESFLQSLYAFNNSILAIDVVGSNKQVYSAGFPKLYYKELEDIWMPEVKAAGGKMQLFSVNLWNGLEPDSEESHLVAIGQAIMRGGYAIGGVFLYLRYSSLVSLFDSHPLLGTQVLLLDENNNPIYQSEDAFRYLDINQPAFTDKLTSLQENGGEIHFQQSDQLILIYRSANTMWTTIAIIPTETLLHDSKVLRGKMGWFIGIVLLAALFISIAVSQGTTRNIKRLNAAMKAVEYGDLKHRDVPYTKDEIGLLSVRFTKMMETIQTLILDIKIKEMKKREADLKALQSQIHPHFLYNTLNTIRYLAKLQHVPNIDEVTDSLIKLLRSATKGGRKLVTLEEELATISSYINIQRYRFVEDFEVKLDVDESLISCLAIPLLLQPLVENALLYGLIGHEIERKSLITIRIAKLPDQQSYVIQVRDNGPGMPPDKLEAIAKGIAAESDDRQMFGIGLANVHERIQLFFGGPYGLRMESRQGEYTLAELHLPIIHSANDSIIPDSTDVSLF